MAYKHFKVTLLLEREVGIIVSDDHYETTEEIKRKIANTLAMHIPTSFGEDLIDSIQCIKERIEYTD